MIRELLTPGLKLEFHLYFNYETDDLEAVAVKRASKSSNYSQSVIWESDLMKNEDIRIEHKVKVLRLP